MRLAAGSTFSGINKIKGILTLAAIVFFLPIGVKAQSGSACIAADPTVLVLPTARSVDPGVSVNFNVRVINNDSADCPARVFQMSAQFNSPISGFFDLPNVFLLPGGIITQTLHLNNPASTPGGTYSIVVMAIDKANSTSLGQGIASLVIVPPSSPCEVNPPVLIVTPTVNYGLAGQSLSYNLFIQNQDSIDCEASTFALSSLFTPGLAGEMSSNTLTLAPSESLNIPLSISSDLNLNAGNYPFTISVSDLNNENHLADSTANYFVILPVPEITRFEIESDELEIELQWKILSLNGQPLRTQISLDGTIVKTKNGTKAEIKAQTAGLHSVQLRTMDALGNYSAWSTPLIVELKARKQKCKDRNKDKDNEKNRRPNL